MDNFNVLTLVIIQARQPTNSNGPNFVELVGYGRDLEEARCHAGFDDPPNDNEEFTEVTVRNGDCQFSRNVADKVCGYHINTDEELPLEIRATLKNLFNQGQFASAIAYCFNMVWDQGFNDT